LADPPPLRGGEGGEVIGRSCTPSGDTVTGQYADDPTRRESTGELVNLRTKLTEMFDGQLWSSNCDP